MKIPLALLLVVATLAASRSASQAEVVDQGTYAVYQDDRSAGSESFTFETDGDSLLLASDVTQKVQTRDGDGVIERRVRVALSGFDYEIRDYLSTTYAFGDSLKRGVVPADTTVTVYRESAAGGEGMTYTKPLGRFFIFETGVFALVDLALRNLSRTSFEERDVTLLMLGSRDTIVTARIQRVGKEKVPWGGTSVVAEHFRVSDPSGSFDAWMHPKGEMIRLISPTHHVRVERKPPAVKPRAKATS